MSLIHRRNLACRPRTETLEGRLGASLFGVEANNQPRQRALVIRAGRTGDPGPTDLPAIPNPRGRPSIAAEASRR